MTNSRNKGATFERDIARLLHSETGIKFQRDLDQYRASDHGDLIADDPDWPFVCELKNHAHHQYRTAYTTQVYAAAEATKKIPAVIYKSGRGKVTVRVWEGAIAAMFGAPATSDTFFETDIQGFCYIAREIMARKALSKKWAAE